jgi:ubiquinone/menaquinone biosynthesis C-methylase UbiE
MQSALKYPGLENEPVKPQSRLRRAASRFLRGQFGRPTGLLGGLVGRIMVRTASNRERIEWTISLLDVKPTDRILEIGFGPGVSIEMLSEVASRGLVVGVDHSDVMVRQAGVRNAAAVREGRVEFHVGSVPHLPKLAGSFDKILTINSIHFWNDPVACLAELRRLLKPGGVIAVTLQPRSRGATEADARQNGEEVARYLERAGFSQVRLEIRQMSPVAAACALAIN